MSKPDRKLLKLQSELATKYGEKSAMFLGNMPKGEYVTTGSLSLDFALGTGGLPTNRVVEIAGLPGSGKSTLAILAMSQFLDAFPEKGAVILDLEHKLSEDWVHKLIGPEKMERVLLLWPDSIEKATDMYVKCCQSGTVSYVMLDSIGGAPTERVLNKSAEIGDVGGNSLGVGRFARFAAGMSNKFDVCTVGVNQARQDMSGYNRLMTPGGEAWKHACIARIQLKVGKDKFFAKVDGEELQVGFSVVAKVIKNQMAPPYRVANWGFFNVETDLYGFGIDRVAEITGLALSVGAVEQRGAWYYHDGLPDGKLRSQAALVEYMKNNEDFREILAKQTIDAVADRGLSSVAPAGKEGDINEDDESVTSKLTDIIIDDFDGAGEENQDPEGDRK